MKRLERMAREGVASSLTKTPTYPKRLSHRRFPKPLSLSCRSLLSIFLFFFAFSVLVPSIEFWASRFLASYTPSETPFLLGNG